jgi:RloB-like protein
VLPSSIGTDPKSVVESAEGIFHSEGRRFERICVVFDRDDHLEYANAIHMAEARITRFRNDERRTVFFEAIVSVPCFELWLLLHFSNVQSWIHRDRALSELKVYIPNYAKGMPNVFDATEPHLSTAVDRAT